MEPLAVQLRKNKNKGNAPKRKSIALSDIDEQIALLEKETQKFDSDDDDDDSDDNDDNEVFDEAIDVVKDSSGKVVRLLSKIETEKIEPLPLSSLPDSQCGKRNTSTRKSVESDSKRKVKFVEEILNTEIIDHNLRKIKGIEATVREMLSNYEPSSVSKHPFFCRACRFQGSSLGDLDIHRQSEFHTIAINIERKASYCKLCKKQFTSPVQLKEHISGQLHKQKLEWFKKQQSSKSKMS